MIIVPRGSRVFTPRLLADAIVDAVDPGPEGRWLEPSYGEGVFLRAISGAGFRQQQIVGLELSDEFVAEVDSLAVCHAGTEAIDWLVTDNREEFDVVVGNPPYVASSELTEELRTKIGRIRDPSTGEPLPRSANLWLAFLLAAIGRLKAGGNFAFVLPASWDFATYAAGVRHWLPSKFQMFAVLRSDTPLFAEVSEGCVVLVGHNFQAPNEVISRFECRDLTSSVAALRRIAVSWPHLQVESRVGGGDSRSLGDVLTVRLGGVTGQASYFLLTEERRAELEIPRLACVPVVSKARHVRSAIVDRLAWDRLRDLGEPVWLFRPRDSDTSLDGVRRYLRRTVATGGCDRTKVKIRGRLPWHRTQLPSSVDGFLSGVTARGLSISFSEYARLSATNTLYVVSFRAEVSTPERFGIAKQLLDREFQASVRQGERRYAGGLRKMEPGDVTGLRIQYPYPKATRSDYIEAYKRLSEI